MIFVCQCYMYMANSTIKQILQVAPMFVYKKTTMADDKDFNNYKTNGVYQNGGTQTYSNAPTETDNGYLVVFELAGNVLQLWVGIFSKDIKARSCTWSQWSSWKSIWGGVKNYLTLLRAICSGVRHERKHHKIPVPASDRGIYGGINSKQCPESIEGGKRRSCRDYIFQFLIVSFRLYLDNFRKIKHSSQNRALVYNNHSCFRRLCWSDFCRYKRERNDTSKTIRYNSYYSDFLTHSRLTGKAVRTA